MRSEGMGRAAWEPQFLALAEQSGEPEGVEAALRQLRELISVMRLFKGGGVGLGPYAFAPTGEGQWRRVATGAAATRPGGYRLNEAEAAELTELASALEARPDPDARPRLGGRALRDGPRARDRAGGPQRPSPGVARGAGGSRTGRRHTGDARRGPDCRRVIRPHRGPRADRARPRAGALADERPGRPIAGASWRSGRRRACAACCAKPPSAPSAPTSAPPPMRP